MMMFKIIGSIVMRQDDQAQDEGQMQSNTGGVHGMLECWGSGTVAQMFGYSLSFTAVLGFTSMVSYRAACTPPRAISSALNHR